MSYFPLTNEPISIYDIYRVMPNPPIPSDLNNNDDLQSRLNEFQRDKSSIYTGIDIFRGGFIAITTITSSLSFTSSSSSQYIFISESINFDRKEELGYITNDFDSYTNSSWITLLNDYNFSRIRVTVSSNSSSSRSGTVRVYHPNNRIFNYVTISISQSAASASLTISPTTMTFMLLGGSGNITITSNTSWSIAISEWWISVNKSSGSGNDSITVSVEPQPSPSLDRTGSVTVVWSGTNRVCTINQSGSGGGIRDDFSTIPML